MRLSHEERQRLKSVIRGSECNFILEKAYITPEKQWIYHVGWEIEMIILEHKF